MANFNLFDPVPTLQMQHEEHHEDRTNTFHKYFIVGYSILSPIIPVATLIINDKYGAQINCQSNSNIAVGRLVETIGMSKWLNISGTFGIIDTIFFVLIAIMFLTKTAKNWAMRLYYVYITIMLFRIAWIIVGAYLYSRDCTSIVGNKPVNDLMLCILILGMFGIGVSYTVIYAYKLI